MRPDVVLVTGASSGIGLELVKQLRDRGVKVYAASRNPSYPVSELEKGPGKIIPVHMDVTIESDVDTAVARIVAENGKLDAVVCNAGNGLAGCIEETSVDEMKYQFETNFFGAAKTVQACLPVFRQQGYGKVMVTSSIAAVVPIPFQAYYSAGKSALSIFMQALAMETKNFGIQCCTVLPGDTQTAFTATRKYAVQSQRPDSAYSVKMKKSVSKMEKDEQNGMSPDFIARKMVRQLMKKRMKLTVVPGFQYKLIYVV